MQTNSILLLSDKALLAHFQVLGTPLPFGVVRLITDRKNGCLGGVPFRMVGKNYVYCPDEVTRFLQNLPLRKPHILPPAKMGRPAVGEKAKADRLGLTVKEFRAGVSQHGFTVKELHEAATKQELRGGVTA